MINLNVRKLEVAKGVDRRGACSPARLPWAPDMQIPQGKQRNSWVWFVHATLSQGCISHRLPASFIHTQIQQQAGALTRVSQRSKGSSLPRGCPGLHAWRCRARRVLQLHRAHTPTQRAETPQGCREPTTPGAVQLVTFCLEQEALTSTETRSALDASCKVQEGMTLMHNLAHRPNLAMEETCQVIKPSARRTLQLSIHRFALSWSQTTQGREGKWEP